jgi:L-alanine-DL-glutamate epimerase-like enolase superfamily enzyme
VIHVLAGAASDRVVAADVLEVAIPLARPVRLRGLTLHEREYIVLRLRTESGLAGAAIGYTRGLPLAATLGEVVPTMLEPDVSSPDSVATRLEERVADAFSSATVRALSLLDLALLDVAAKRSGVPLWRLLGGARSRVPILAVAGYFLEERTVEDVQSELRELAARGFRHLKVHAHEPALVAQLAAVVPPGVGFAVDLQMRYRELGEAAETCQRLDELGLAFIEDPFPPELPELTRALADLLATPIAAGEDAPGQAALLAITDAADVVRVDATSSGGLEVIAAATRAASSSGKPVITHAFLELHGQIAGGLPGVTLAETIPYESGANPIDQLLAETQRVDAGDLVLSERPGNGLAFDWDAVGRHTRTAQSYDLERRKACS